MYCYCLIISIVIYFIVLLYSIIDCIVYCLYFNCVNNIYIVLVILLIVYMLYTVYLLYYLCCIIWMKHIYY